MSDLRLGCIGLGNMGAPMAKRMIDWPGGLTAFDVRATAMAPLAEAGADIAASVAEVGANADIISVTVLDDAQVEQVLAELVTTAKPDTVIAIHSTIADTTAVALAEQYRPRGVHVIDAPVSGGAGAAEQGRLATMVGADRAIYELIKPAFKQWASLVIHAGLPGAGTRMKLARNMLTFTCFAAVGEALALAEAAGLDLQALGRVVRHTDALTFGPGAIMFRDNTAEITPADPLYQPLCHTRDLGEKDLRLALAMAQNLGLELPLAQLASAELAPGLGVPHSTTDRGEP